MSARRIGRQALAARACRYERGVMSRSAERAVMRRSSAAPDAPSRVPTTSSPPRAETSTSVAATPLSPAAVAAHVTRHAERFNTLTLLSAEVAAAIYALERMPLMMRFFRSSPVVTPATSKTVSSRTPALRHVRAISAQKDICFDRRTAHFPIIFSHARSATAKDKRRLRRHMRAAE